NPEAFSHDNVIDHTEAFCGTFVGKELAPKAARILDKGTKYSSRVTAEMLDHRTFNLSTGEWDRVVSDWVSLERDAFDLYSRIAPEGRDAFNELILFPIRLLTNLHEMYFAQAKNLFLAEKGDPAANSWADKVEEAFRKDALLMESYNKDIAGGKWNGMMTQKHIGYTSWNDDFEADTLPLTKRVADGPVTFTADGGKVAMDAEHFYSSRSGEGKSWTVYRDFGRVNGAIALTPYTLSPDGDSLTYRFSTDGEIPSEAKVHVIVRPTLDFTGEGGQYSVSLDGSTPERVLFNLNLNEDPQNIYSVYYPTVASRAVDSTVTLPLDTEAMVHTLTITPLSPGTVFERIVVDMGGYTGEYLFGEESPKSVR
ncbi:MAG: glycosyhydrolase, partial [Bacteroidales bacterium]|nr:glycosyhydrolase [Bacteroidales bacterium]